MHFHVGRRWVGKDAGMFTQILLSPEGAFCEGVIANPFRVNSP